MHQYSDVVIGISTRGRLPIVEAQGRSLKRCNGVGEAMILVLDDCSEDYGPDQLISIYPPGTMITRNEHHSGAASYMSRRIIEAMVGTGREVLIILDSDLICASDFVDTSLAMMPRTQGFMSLLNAPSHPALREGDELVEKDHVGAAGCVIRRDLAVDILKAVEPGLRFDWRVCDYLRSAGIPILCLKNSAVQHIGFAGGQNASMVKGDFGTGFGDYSPVNAAIMFETVVAVMQSGFRSLAMHVEVQRREIARLKAEIAGVKTTNPAMGNSMAEDKENATARR